MTCINLTETGLIGIIGMCFGFLISCCRQIEQSRCKNISMGCIKCDREPLTEDTILEMNQQNDAENNV
tara:strand:- start:530 stop:733 length:204 start_codon:yes stop_codon:yes gene_type:complete